MSTISPVSAGAYPLYGGSQTAAAAAPAQAASQQVTGYDPDHDGDQDKPGQLDVKG